jgi:hypothetical protein
MQGLLGSAPGQASSLTLRWTLDLGSLPVDRGRRIELPSLRVRPILTEHALAGRTHVDQRNAEFLVGRDSRNQFISQKTRRSLWQPMAVDGRRVATVERSHLEWRCHFNSDRRCCFEIEKETADERQRKYCAHHTAGEAGVTRRDLECGSSLHGWRRNPAPRTRSRLCWCLTIWAYPRGASKTCGSARPGPRGRLRFANYVNFVL